MCLSTLTFKAFCHQLFEQELQYDCVLCVTFVPLVFLIISSRCLRLGTTAGWNYVFSFDKILFIFTYNNLRLVGLAEVKWLG